MLAVKYRCEDDIWHLNFEEMKKISVTLGLTSVTQSVIMMDIGNIILQFGRRS